MAATEISPHMTTEQIRAILMGLLISGGMLIPGNIPNIISAGKLNIKSREWALVGIHLFISWFSCIFHHTFCNLILLYSVCKSPYSLYFNSYNVSRF